MELQEIIDLGFKEEVRPYYGSTGKAHFVINFIVEGVDYRYQNGRVILEYWDLTKQIVMNAEQGGDGEPGQFTSVSLPFVDTIEKLKQFIYLLTNHQL